MSRYGQWTLAALGTALIVCALSGRALLFVRPWFLLAVLGTGVVVLVVAWRGQAVVSPSAGVMLMLPLVAGLTLTPTLVGQASQGSVSASALAGRIGDGPNPLVDGRGGNVTLLQVLLAEQQVGGVYLAGRSISVVAIVRGPHELGRSAIVCCAADARTIALSASGTALPEVGTWVRVTGRLTMRGQRLILDAQDIQSVPTPTDPFL